MVEVVLAVVVVVVVVEVEEVVVEVVVAWWGWLERSRGSEVYGGAPHLTFSLVLISTSICWLDVIE